MNRLPQILLTVTLVWATFPVGTACAAEIRLIDRVTVEPGIVKLGDVAELFGAPEKVTDRLAEVELFPAPVGKRQETVSARRVIDILVRRGVSFGEHRISGSSRITLVPAERRAAESKRQRRSDQIVEQHELEAAEIAVERALLRLLDRETRSLDADTEATEWQVEFKLTPQQAIWILESEYRFSVSGGVAPFDGSQRFEVAAVVRDGQVHRFRLQVKTKRPRRVVVAVQNLPRGTVILDSDVRMETLDDSNNLRAVATSLEEVVGKESTGSLRANKPIPTRSLREPILVRRGEFVTVIAISGGIRIETQGKARQDGSLNQLIAVETMGKKRKSYQARVSDLQEVQVYAGAVAKR